jgi:hypothetical protein
VSRFLLTVLFSGAISIGVITSANATTKLVTTAVAPALTAPVLTVADHCGRHRHWVPRYRRHGHWYGGYCARN